MKSIFKFSGILFLTITMSFNLIEEDKKVIVIDSGHGGKDSGVVFENILEKNIVETISKKIKNFSSNIDIILLHENDEFISLNSRVKKINNIKPDLVLSLHLGESEDASVNGVEAIVSEKNAYLKESIQKAKILVLSFKNNENLSPKGISKADLYILRESKCSAILLNLGFLTNKINRDYLTSEEGQNKISKRILEFLN